MGGVCSGDFEVQVEIVRGYINADDSEDGARSPG
jgi:hypothetical protein